MDGSGVYTPRPGTDRYDANNNRLSMIDGTGTTGDTYDELDRLLSVTSPGPKIVGYQHDLDGNRRKLLYPDNTAVTYSFDKASQLAWLADWAAPANPSCTPTPTARTTYYQYFPDSHHSGADKFPGKYPGAIGRTGEAADIIGWDQATHAPTRTYSVLTTTAGELITANPGLP
jgi:YD repeat-containing protein